MSIVFEQVFVLCAFVVVGYVLTKTGIVAAEHSKILSGLLVYVFLPCNIFNTFSTNFSVTYLTANYPLLVTSLVLQAVLLTGSFFGAKLFSKHPYERRIYEYSLAVPNFGYMGYALSEGLLGSAGLIDFMIFALPVNVYTYTMGYARLTKRSMNLKGLLNPVMIATALGILAGITGYRPPAIFMDVVDKARGCMGPVSMLLAGIVMAQFPVKQILGNWKIYPVIALRLLIIPGLVGLSLLGLNKPDILRIAVLFYALPCGMNTVVFPKLVDENCHIGAGMGMISTLLACGTIPLVFHLFGIGL